MAKAKNVSVRGTFSPCDDDSSKRVRSFNVLHFDPLQSIFAVDEMDEDNPMKVPLYRPNADEWPPHGVDVERERLLHGLDTLMQMDVTEQFRSPGNDSVVGSSNGDGRTPRSSVH